MRCELPSLNNKMPILLMTLTHTSQQNAVDHLPRRDSQNGSMDNTFALTSLFWAPKIYMSLSIGNTYRCMPSMRICCLLQSMHSANACMMERSMHVFTKSSNKCQTWLGIPLQRRQLLLDAAASWLQRQLKPCMQAMSKIHCQTAQFCRMVQDNAIR